MDEPRWLAAWNPRWYVDDGISSPPCGWVARGPQTSIQAAARDATGVSTVRSRRRLSYNFAGRQQLVEWAPMSGMPLCNF